MFFIEFYSNTIICLNMSVRNNAQLNDLMRIAKLLGCYMLHINTLKFFIVLTGKHSQNTRISSDLLNSKHIEALQFPLQNAYILLNILKL